MPAKGIQPGVDHRVSFRLQIDAPEGKYKKEGGQQKKKTKQGQRQTEDPQQKREDKSSLSAKGGHQGTAEQSGEAAKEKGSCKSRISRQLEAIEEIQQQKGGAARPQRSAFQIPLAQKPIPVISMPVLVEMLGPA